MQRYEKNTNYASEDSGQRDNRAEAEFSIACEATFRSREETHEPRNFPAPQLTVRVFRGYGLAARLVSREVYETCRGVSIMQIDQRFSL